MFLFILHVIFLIINMDGRELGLHACNVINLNSF